MDNGGPAERFSERQDRDIARHRLYALAQLQVQDSWSVRQGSARHGDPRWELCDG
jgi:hypothetical protein